MVIVTFFIEKNSLPYEGIIYLRWMLHRINIYYFITYLFLAIHYFQINDAF